MTDPMLIGVLLPFAAALVAPRVARGLGRHTGWLLALVPAGIFATFWRWLPIVPGEVRTSRLSWVPDLGVELSFLADGLSITFVLLITGIGTLVLVYAGGYLAGDPRLGRFYGFILAFMGSMLGLVLADNVITMFVFWELTSVCSYLLIGFDHETENGRASALKALVVTAAGGLVLLAGLILLMIAGVQLGLSGADAGRISALLSVDIRGHGLYPAIFVLILLGCVTKSAQVPFHFWLPAAMAGPTPVSAYLHSATMVKAGIYLLARMHPMLGDTWLWNNVVTAFGLATMLLGAIATLGQKDLKRILAYSTLAVLGTLVMLIGVGTEMAIKTAVVYLVAHAFYKAALFMVAGNIDHETGTRDVTLLGGLRRLMPLTATAGLLAALSKAGAPPMFGFIGKELLYKTKITIDSVGAWLILAAVIANVALVASALLVSVKPFLGKLKTTPKKPHEAPLSMIVGPVLLAFLGLARGLQPEPFENNIGSAAASAILGESVTMKLKLWHGVDPLALSVLALSFLTLAMGFGVFRIVKTRLTPIGAAMHRLESVGPARLYEISLAGLYRGAGWFTRIVQSGYLRHYVMATVIVAVAVVGYPLLRTSTAALDAHSTSWRVHEVLLAVLAAAGAVLATRRQRLAAVAAIGVTGLAVALLFVSFSAPDLAMTQIVVETLSVILLVLVFYHLPETVRRSGPGVRVRDLGVALAIGVVMTGLVLAAGGFTPEREVAEYFLAESGPAAHGRNVVNVILVDFRAMDTLGEVTVLAVAGLGVWALLGLRLFRRNGEGGRRA
jgi:multicomponent Na+:H+ antiporter subunit A